MMDHLYQQKNENIKVYYEAFSKDDPDFIFRVYANIGHETKISDNYKRRQITPVLGLDD